MATRRTNESNPTGTRRPPATTPEARENQLIALAVDLAEKQMLDGSASAQVVSHFLKLGSSREKLEQARIEMEIDLLDAKKEAMAAHARIEEMYGAALDAMRSYAGQAPRQIEAEFDD